MEYLAPFTAETAEVDAVVLSSGLASRLAEAGACMDLLSTDLERTNGNVFE